jgi:segregation and condensation protein B
MATAQETADLVRDFMKDETTGELTKPSLETLTIVAYRGPLTKAEIEQVRGVNCSMILRNLMMRGLVESMGEHGNPLTQYRVTMDFLRFLGLSSVEELPDYDTLRSSENVRRVLEESKEEVAAEPAPTDEVAAEPAPAPSRGPDSASEEESEEKEPAEAN